MLEVAVGAALLIVFGGFCVREYASYRLPKDHWLNWLLNDSVNQGGSGSGGGTFGDGDGCGGD